MVDFSIEGMKFRSGSLDPGLYVVATPIGNLSDISVRALKTLAGADVIACEDSRKTGKLLKHFAITTPMMAYHEHNSGKAGPKLISILQEGKIVALVSDAGTPLISDPGYRLVTRAREEGIKIIPVPGPSAALAALVASGLPTDNFLFAGFLPSKEKLRQKKLTELADLPTTLIFFESPNRLQNSIGDMVKILGADRMAAICREMTKLHEEITSASLRELIKVYENRTIKGEIVIVVAAPHQRQVIEVDQLLSELLETMSVSRAASEAASLTGKSKRQTYLRALTIAKQRNEILTAK